MILINLSQQQILLVPIENQETADLLNFIKLSWIFYYRKDKLTFKITCAKRVKRDTHEASSKASYHGYYIK